MRAARDAADVLALWERGAARHRSTARCCSAPGARPSCAPDALADLPLGRVNAALLGCAQRSFGARIEARVDCARCGERLELALERTTLLPRPRRRATPAASSKSMACASALPSLRDLAAVAGERDPTRPRAAAERCCVAACRARLAALAPARRLAAREVEAALEALDPAPTSRSTCTATPAATHGTRSLDVGALLWDEIDARARGAARRGARAGARLRLDRARDPRAQRARRAAYLGMVAA